MPAGVYIAGNARGRSAHERDPAGVPRVRRVFSEHQVRLKTVDPEEDQVQCPNCGSSRMEPYAFDPDGPTDNPFEKEDEGE